MVASEAQAVSPDGDFVWARDLQLSAHAARRIDGEQNVPKNARAEYPLALKDLEELSLLRSARASADELANPLKAADEARKRMRLWAGETASGDNSQHRSPHPKKSRWNPIAPALEIAAAEAEKRFEQNAKLNRATTMNSADAAPSGSPETKTESSMSPDESEQRLERLSAQQQVLRNQTAAASDSDLKELAKEQRALTDAIENARPKQPAPQQNDTVQSANPPRDQAEQDSQKDPRLSAMNAIRSAQERLLEMPHEIQAAQALEAKQHDADSIAEQEHQEAISADPEAKPAAQQLADDARAAADIAKDQAKSAQVSPDEAAGVAASLRKFAPESSPAVDAIDEQLTPALTTMRQTQSAGDHNAYQRSAQQANQAVAEVQRRLNDGLQSLLNQEAIAAAKFFSSNAAQALARPQPDRASALRLQCGASAALEQAWDQALHRAAGQRLSQLPALSGVLGLYPTETNVDGPIVLGAEPAPAEREWGRLRQQQPDELSAGSHEIDAPEYQDSLRVYFRDLAHEDGAAKR